MTELAARRSSCVDLNRLDMIQRHAAVIDLASVSRNRSLDHGKERRSLFAQMLNRNRDAAARHEHRRDLHGRAARN